MLQRYIGFLSDLQRSARCNMDRMSSRGLKLAIAVVVVVCSNCAAAETMVDNSTPPAQLPKSEHGRVFDEAVHILGGNVNVISKWIRPIRLVVVGDVVNDTSVESGGELEGGAAGYAARVIAEISSLTRLNVAVARDSYSSADAYLRAINRSAQFTLSDCVDSATDDNGCGNFFVIFADVEKMEAIVKAIPMRPVYQKAFSNPDAIKCFFSPFQTVYMEIRQALVFVRNDLPLEMVRTCLQEEIYQSFGMFNDSTGSRYYSFNNKIEPKAITRYDRALLETIYDNSFRQGAPVFMVVKKLMDKLGLDPFGEK